MHRPPAFVPPVGDRPAPLFLGEHLAMDLLNSRAVPGGVEVEWLADGADLLVWWAAAGLPPPPVEAGHLDEAAARVRALREAFRRFVDRHAGKPLKPAAVDELRDLNELLATDHSYRQLGKAVGKSDPAVLWRRHRRTDPLHPAAAFLLPLADAIGDLITTADFRLVRHCQGVGCTLSFIDQTKSHARRWCSMGTCGNRAKAAAHRARQRRPT